MNGRGEYANDEEHQLFDRDIFPHCNKPSLTTELAAFGAAHAANVA